jgi:hypothetical protein
MASPETRRRVRIRRLWAPSWAYPGGVNHHVPMRSWRERQGGMNFPKRSRSRWNAAFFAEIRGSRFALFFGERLKIQSLSKKKGKPRPSDFREKRSIAPRRARNSGIHTLQRRVLEEPQNVVIGVERVPRFRVSRRSNPHGGRVFCFPF